MKAIQKNKMTPGNWLTPLCTTEHNQYKATQEKKLMRKTKEKTEFVNNPMHHPALLTTFEIAYWELFD